MKVFRRVISVGLTAVIMTQIISSSVLADSGTGQVTTAAKAASPQIINSVLPKSALDDYLSQIKPLKNSAGAPIQSTGINNALAKKPQALSLMPKMSVLSKDTVKPAKSKNKKRLLIKYKTVQGHEKLKNLTSDNLKLSNLKLKKALKEKKFKVYEVDESLAASVESELKKDTDIEYVQEDKQLTLFDMPADTDFSKQWGLSNAGQTVGTQSGTSGVDINALSAWSKTKGSGSVAVGVLDTGVDINHEDLRDNIYVNTSENTNDGIDSDNNGVIDDSNGWDFANDDKTVFDSADGDKHGTHVAGIIAAAQNGKGIIGVAPNIKIVPLKFINNGIGYTSDAIDAIEYCKKMGIRIVNCSWGGTEENPALKDEMANSGILFVCAAGNFGSSSIPVYPANFNLPNVISVAAIDNKGSLASFSNYGSTIDVAAPGVDIYSTLPGNSYGLMNGTSMASPFAAAEAALIMSADPNLSITDIADRIRKNVVISNELSGKVSSGGRIDAAAAINAAPSTRTDNNPVPATSPALILNNYQNKKIDVSGKASGGNTADANGKTVKPLIAEDTPSNAGQKNTSCGSIGLDTTKSNLGSQSISALSYIMESEPNDTSSTSMTISEGTVYGTISTSSDSDWYAVNLDANKQYKLKLKGIPQGNDFDLYAFDSNLQAAGSSASLGNADESITINTTQAGCYYIDVSCHTFAQGGDHSYQLMVYSNTSQPDSLEPNETMSTAKSLENNTVISANININTDEDWYYIDAEKAGRLVVSMTGVPQGCDFDMTVYNSSAVSIGGSYNSSNKCEKASIMISTPGRYYIRVYSYSNCDPSSDYMLIASVSTPDSYESNENMHDSNILTEGSSLLATIDSPLDEDWYRIVSNSSKDIKLSLQHIPEEADYDLYIYDSAGNCLVSSVSGGNADESITRQLGDGVFFVRVVSCSGYSEVGQYSLSLSGASALTISIPYVKSTSGSAVSVPVSIDNLPPEGISCCNFSIKYDKRALTYTGFEAGALTNTTNAEIFVEDAYDGINVFYCDNSSSFNCPILNPGELVRLNFSLNEGTSDGSYILSYNNGWSFGKPLPDGKFEELGEALFKSGMVTTGVFNTYSEGSLSSTNEQPRMRAFDASTAFCLGDVSGDGSITGVDYILLKKHIASSSDNFTSNQIKASDINIDGNIDVFDSTLLKAYILKKIYYFPKENIALGKTSSSDTGTPANGNDGRASTSWSASDSLTTHSWSVDLGACYNIAGTGITWTSADVFKYKIDVSYDGTTWTTVVDKQSNTVSQGYSKDTFSSLSQRFVRISITGLPAGKSAGFSEFAVFKSSEELPDMPTGRYYLGAAVLDNKIYAIGGYKQVGYYLDKTEVYDPKMNTWSGVQNLNIGRAGIGVAELYGKIYAIGGYTAEETNTAERYDPVSGWALIDRMDTPRASFACITAEDKIYVIGGSYGHDVLDSVEAYDPKTGHWTKKSHLVTPRYKCVAATVKGKIYVFSGYTNNSDNYDNYIDYSVQ